MGPGINLGASVNGQAPALEEGQRTSALNYLLYYIILVLRETVKFLRRHFHASILPAALAPHFDKHQLHAPVVQQRAQRQLMRPVVGKLQRVHHPPAVKLLDGPAVFAAHQDHAHRFGGSYFMARFVQPVQPIDVCPPVAPLDGNRPAFDGGAAGAVVAALIGGHGGAALEFRAECGILAIGEGQAFPLWCKDCIQLRLYTMYITTVAQASYMFVRVWSQKRA